MQNALSAHIYCNAHRYVYKEYVFPGDYVVCKANDAINSTEYDKSEMKIAFVFLFKSYSSILDIQKGAIYI